MKNAYGFRLPNSLLVVYGHNMSACKPYIENAIDSVEDICKYCREHDLHILCKPILSIAGLLEYLRVRRLTGKYSVNGSWSDFSKYADD